MKIHCSKCGAEFEALNSGVIACPYCGCEQFVDKANDDADEFFGDYTPAYQPVQQFYEPVKPAYHSSFGDDAKSNKAVKTLFGFSIAILVLCVLRFISGLTGIDDIDIIAQSLPEFSGTQLYQPMSAYVAFSYAELALLVVLFVCSIVLAYFVCKVYKNKFPVSDENVFATYKKAFIASCVFTGAMVIYAVVEVVGIVLISILEKLLEEQIVLFGFKFGVILGAALLLAFGIISLVYLKKLSKKQD